MKSPRINILADAGGAFPVLSGRLKLLGTESWVPNPNEFTRSDPGIASDIVF